MRSQHTNWDQPGELIHRVRQLRQLLLQLLIFLLLPLTLLLLLSHSLLLQLLLPQLPLLLLLVWFLVWRTCICDIKSLRGIDLQSSLPAGTGSKHAANALSY
jgi:hypothetical protein